MIRSDFKKMERKPKQKPLIEPVSEKASEEGEVEKIVDEAALASFMLEHPEFDEDAAREALKQIKQEQTEEEKLEE